MDLGGLLQTTIDLGPFRRMQIALRNPDLRDAWKAARKPLMDDQRDHSKRAEGPDGPWAPRSSATKTRSSARKRKRKPLGRLPLANKTTIERLKMTMVDPIKWSGSHQEGDTVGHGARLPARVFRWVSATAGEKVAAIVAKGIAYAIEVS